MALWDLVFLVYPKRNEKYYINILITERGKHKKNNAYKTLLMNLKYSQQGALKHPVGRQSQPRRAQVREYLSNQKRWSQDLPLSGPHLRIDSRGKGISSGDLFLPEDLIGLLKVSGFFLLFFP